MIAIIGGSGLDSFAGLEIRERKCISTSWGEPSAALTLGSLKGIEVVFLARHGDQHQPPPHKVNYRANIAALKALGVDHILAVNSVGGISAGMDSGELVVPDQLIDYTWGRAHTFFDGGQPQLPGQGAPVAHIDFTYPFDIELRKLLLSCAERKGIEVQGRATCAVTQGPRLETAAEIRKFAADGCDIVGMTSMPEAALAREADIAYACLALVVNAAAGVAEQLITMDDIRATMSARLPVVRGLLADVCARLEKGDEEV